MQHIPTPSSTVSKLKKAAKLAARKAGITHAEALDQVAKEGGYLHWKHVTDCADRTLVGERTLPTVTGLSFAKRVQHAQRLTLVFGPTGAGKTIYAMDVALNAMRDGLAVHVLDVGRSYSGMCQALGGTLSTVLPSGAEGEHVRHGSARLTVQDLEPALPIVGKEPTARLTPKLDTDLLIVDELWQVIKLYDVLAIVREQLDRGGSALVVSMDPPTLSPAQEMAVMPIAATVRRTVVHFDSKLRMGFIAGDVGAYRSFEGGKHVALAMPRDGFRARKDMALAAHVQNLKDPAGEDSHNQGGGDGTA